MIVTHNDFSVNLENVRYFYPFNSAIVFVFEEGREKQVQFGSKKERDLAYQKILTNTNSIMLDNLLPQVDNVYDTTKPPAGDLEKLQILTEEIKGKF